MPLRKAVENKKRKLNESVPTISSFAVKQSGFLATNKSMNLSINNSVKNTFEEMKIDLPKKVNAENTKL